METYFDLSLPLIYCAPSELNQVFLNIIINATHAIKDVVGENGDIKGRIKIETFNKDKLVEIRISDTGRGIPKSIQDRIFDPFFTTKDVGQGTGQGLTIVYNIITNKHDGTITFRTKKDKCTTFILQLPIIETKDS